jgi:hypothetical protein
MSVQPWPGRHGDMPYPEGPHAQATDRTDQVLRAFLASTEIRPAADLTTRIRDRVAREPRSTAPRRFVAALWAHSLPGIWRGFVQSGQAALDPGTRSVVLRVQALIIVLAVIGVTSLGGAAALAAAVRVVDELRSPVVTERDLPLRRGQSSDAARPMTDGPPGRPGDAGPRRGDTDESTYQPGRVGSPRRDASSEGPTLSDHAGGTAANGQASDPNRGTDDGAADELGSARATGEAGTRAHGHATKGKASAATAKVKSARAAGSHGQSGASNGQANGKEGTAPKGKAKGHDGTRGSSADSPRRGLGAASGHGDAHGNPHGEPLGQAKDQPGPSPNSNAKGHTGASGDPPGRSDGGNGNARGQADPTGNARGQGHGTARGQGHGAARGHDGTSDQSEAASTPSDGEGRPDAHDHPHGGPRGQAYLGAPPEGAEGDAESEADPPGNAHHEPSGQTSDAAGTPSDGGGPADPGHPHGGPPGQADPKKATSDGTGA